MYLVDVKNVLLHTHTIFLIPEKKQQTMRGFLMGNASCTPQQAAVLTDSILNMLVTDMRPRRWLKMTASLNDPHLEPWLHSALQDSLHKAHGEKTSASVCVCSVV